MPQEKKVIKYHEHISDINYKNYVSYKVFIGQYLNKDEICDLCPNRIRKVTKAQVCLMGSCTEVKINEFMVTCSHINDNDLIRTYNEQRLRYGDYSYGS